MKENGITYIITLNKRQSLQQLLESVPENTDITYINSTTPEILLNPYPLTNYQINYERFENLQQLIEYVHKIHHQIVIIEELSLLLNERNNEALLVQLIKQLYTHTSFLLDLKRNEFIELMVDKTIT